ncbi:MAG: helicase-exonuclease AddAB subunit AddA [Oscillibacter sp.]|nr:helicase-exonuclease AddAB subunit AddA [Oscillibacter sp.]
MSVTLTPEQSAAVENRGGQLLVSAAAGSGKTKVLVERLFRYVEREHKNLDEFLIITYTKAAAAELRGKIAGELSKRVGENPGNEHLRRQMLRVYQADIKTVDAFCTGLLRENTHLLAREGDRHALTPDFRVLDEPEAALLRERVLRRTLEAFYENLSEGGALLADTMGAGRDDSALVSLALEVYEKLQSHAWPMRWLEQSRNVWKMLSSGVVSFDTTAYASELLSVVRRRGVYWETLLRESAAKTVADPKLKKGYGDKFLTAAAGMDALSRVAHWDDAAQLAELVTFPRVTTPKGRADDPLIVSLKRVWETCKDGLKALCKTIAVSGADAMEDLRTIAPAMIALLDLVSDFSEAYRAEKLRINAADFPDQEHLSLQLLLSEDGTPTETGRQISGRYTEILVDEYQDTNEVQNAIFRAVSKDQQNLFVVGDVKQSIYRFRLADPTIFLRKYGQFLPYEQAANGQERKILLSKNFRSRREILDATNFVFTNILSPEMGEMSYGAEEALHFGAAYYPPRDDCATEFHLITARRRSGDDDPENPPVRRVTAEARFVAGRIRELLDGAFPVTDADGGFRACRPEDIVILMRSPRSRTAAFFEALSERDIPCSFDESGGFFDTMEVSTAFALLQIVDNPRQDVPLIAVLRSPVFAFTADRLAEIRARHTKGDFYDALRAAAGLPDEISAPEDGLPDDVPASENAETPDTDAEPEPGDPDCVAFLDTLSELRRAAPDMGVYEFYCHLCGRLNLLGLFGAMDAGEERRENLLTFGRHAERFEQNGYRGLFAFVTQTRRLIDAGRMPPGQSGTHSGVRLMSIHKSKGLEFPVVILADLDHAFSRQDFDAPVLVHPELGLGPRYVDLRRRIRYPTLARIALEERLRRENLAEEQRILYVAMTRPKEKLIMVDTVYGTEKKLQKFASVTGCPVRPESVADGKSFGDWLLLSLLTRPEASALRDAAGVEPDSLWTGDDSPWDVFTHDAEVFRDIPDAAQTVRDKKSASAAFDPALLSWRYPYGLETALPAKLTATQLKGRPVDEEISENAAHTPALRPLSQPRFRWEAHGLTPAERGTATHLLLQHLDFSGAAASEQAAELVKQRLLTPEQADAVNFRAVDRFLSSPLADEIRNAHNIRREYRFTLLMDASAYDARARAGDTVLLQGVVDCCFETDAGITVVDFKTDYVRNAERLAARVEAYRPQLRAYSDALQRVLEVPVVRRTLYFLDTGATVDV